MRLLELNNLFLINVKKLVNYLIEVWTLKKSNSDDALHEEAAKTSAEVDLI